jgi:hypothetical protein
MPRHLAAGQPAGRHPVVSLADWNLPKIDIVAD